MGSRGDITPPTDSRGGVIPLLPPPLPTPLQYHPGGGRYIEKRCKLGTLKFYQKLILLCKVFDFLLLKGDSGKFVGT